MRIKHVFLLLIIAIAVPFLSACNNTDDVAGIFTGKTWKLSAILYEKNEKEVLDYWDLTTEAGKKAHENSIKLLKEENTFTLRFEGIETSGIITGNFSGIAAAAVVGGEWSANGENQDLSIRQEVKSDSDVLGTAFIKALSTAYKYKGDYSTLYIYFKDGATKKVLLLFAPPQN